MSLTITLETAPRPLKDGKVQIVARITEAGQHRRIATGYSCLRQHWNKQLQKIKSNERKPKTVSIPYWEMHLEAIQEVNNALDAFKARLVTLVAKEEASTGLKPTKEQLVALFQTKGKTGIKAYYEDREATMFGAKGKLLSPATKARYRSLIDKVLAYRSVQTKREEQDMQFSRIDLAFLKGYTAHYMHSERNSGSTVNANLKILKALMQRVRKEGLIESDPWPMFTMPSRDTKADTFRLSKEDYKKIATYNDSNHWRYAFTIMCLTGLRISDVLALKWEHIQDGAISFTAKKTNKTGYIPLSPRLKSLVASFGTNSGYVVPFYTELAHDLNKKSSGTTLSNKYLKSLSSKLGIKGKISNHLGRKSFSAFAQEAGCDTGLIADLLQHSPKGLTKAYSGRYLDETIKEAFEKVERYIYGS